MVFVRVESRVLLAQEDYNARNEIIKEYRNYISSCAQKVAGRYISDQDDEMSIAMIAFDEAITKYDHSKGSFLKFADIIIKNRLIDFMRKEYKDSKTVPFSELATTDKNGDEISLYLEDTRSNNNDAKYEIEALTLELSKYDISFFELSKISPKFKKTKAACFAVIKYIVENPELINEVKQKGIIPIKTLVSAVKVNRKIIERHRKYIIAAVIILTGNYDIIADYFKEIKEV